MNRVPGLLRSSRVGLEGDNGDVDIDDWEPTSVLKLDLREKNVEDKAERSQC